MKVKAKFQVGDVTKHAYGAETVTLHPVYEGATANAREDKSFADTTPSGNISLTITNKDVHGHFVPGEAHYITFEKAVSE